MKIKKLKFKNIKNFRLINQNMNIWILEISRLKSFYKVLMKCRVSWKFYSQVCKNIIIIKQNIKNKMTLKFINL